MNGICTDERRKKQPCTSGFKALLPDGCDTFWSYVSDTHAELVTNQLTFPIPSTPMPRPTQDLTQCMLSYTLIMY